MSKGGGPCRGAVIRPGTRERGILFLEGKKGIGWNGEYVASRNRREREDLWSQRITGYAGGW